MNVLLWAALAFACGYLLGRRQGTGGADRERPAAPIDGKALELARRVLPLEGRIGAIRAYREATGVGLRDAKRAVDSLGPGDG